jgi:hypothetical protein
MKKYIKLLIGLPLIALTFNACHDPDLMPAPDPEWAPVAVVKWTDANKSFFNISQIESAEFEYLLYGEDFGYANSEVTEIEVYLSMNDQDKTLFNIYTEFPVTVNVPSGTAAAAFGLTANDLAVGDKFTFSYVVKSIDGRVFDLYGNNICNLIRVEGICSLDAYVLSPTIPEAKVSSANNKFSLAAITESGDDEYAFDLKKKDFVEVDLSSVGIELAYTDSAGTSDFMMIESFTPSSIPAAVSITASEAAALFGKTTSDLMPGDEFTIKFTFETPTGSFSNYQSALCGVNFPGTIVHPFHNGKTGDFPDYGYVNTNGTATAPPATSTSGSCSLTISVTE